ncbi:DUF4232 domain-containing protein [Dactylosporangium sp. NPDC000555]|uniref:DUF4232 domain-containing protein n=1 Tax=Dactylosporangium sp. NPDC000555 TaxID=3154260 RepID=UPI003317285C
MIDPDDHFDDQFEGWLDRHRVEPLNPAPGVYERVTRSARRRRTVRVTAVAAAVAVTLTGVTGVGYRIATGPGPVLPPGASASPSPPAPPSPEPPPFSHSPEPAVTGSSGTFPSSPTTSTSQSSQSSRCRTGDLKVTGQGAPGGGAAGSLYMWLVFTNVSSRTCTLHGYPGVSTVTGPSGQQINDPLKRSTFVKPTQVVLAPRGVAHATVRQGQPEQFEPECHTVDVAGFRVYPPDETVSVFVPWSGKACSTKGINVGEVWPVVAGLSE